MAEANVVIDDVKEGEETSTPPEEHPSDRSESTGEAPEEEKKEVKKEEAAAPPESEKPRKSRAKDRIQGLIRDGHSKDQEINRLKEEAKAYKAPDIGKQPQEEDFKDDQGYVDTDEYDKAVAEYTDKRIDSKVESSVHAQRVKTSEDEAAGYVQKINQEFNEFVDEVAKDRPAGFKEAIDALSDEKNQQIFPEGVANFILESDVGPDLAKFCADNRGVLDEMLSQSPGQVMRTMVALESKITADLKTKKVSDAPPPITPVDEGGGAIDKNEDEMTDEEWLVHRNKTKKIL